MLVKISDYAINHLYLYSYIINILSKGYILTYIHKGRRINVYKNSPLTVHYLRNGKN